MSTATDMLAAYIAAETAVLAGQSVALGGKQLTRANLAEIRRGRAEWQARVDAESAQAVGRTGPRHVLADFSQ